jgi:hypothetical protein
MNKRGKGDFGVSREEDGISTGPPWQVGLDLFT